MSIYNLNPRRVVWFSPNEPSNKYDIWLSRNAHLDENGEPTTDSNLQRDCDYIFKIYDCGKWNPIAGFNTTAANKINTVASADGYQENHVPLFGNPSNSPDELVDGGTIGDVIYNHMTESDWEHILENGGLGTAITEYSTENPFHLNYAGHQIVGGIWADRFTLSYDDTSAANKTYLAQAKYRYQQTASDYNLYVHAKDIIGAINTYQVENPNEPGINVGGDISIETLLGLFKNTATLEREVIFNSLNHPIIKDNIWGAGSANSGNAGKLLKLKDTLQDLTEYNAQNNFIEWVSPEELFNEYYELEVASLTALGGIKADTHAGLLLGKYVAECKLYNPSYLVQPNSYKKEALCIDVRDVKQALDDWYADNDSTIWDLDILSSCGISTMKRTSIDDDNVTHIAYAHVLDHYAENMKEGLYPRNKTYSNPVPGLYNGTKGLEWVEAQTIVEEGLGISSGTGYLYYNGGAFVLDSGTGGGGSGTTYYPLSSSNYTTAGNYVIGVSSGGTGGSTHYLNGLGQWTTPPNTTYNDFSGSTHGLVPASTAASQDKYLKGNGTWDTPTVSVFNINLAVSLEDDANFTLNNLRLSSDSTLNPIDRTLEEWNYYNIDGDSKTTQFTFTNTHVSGNAIYIRFNAGPHSDVTINTDADIIFSNMPSVSLSSSIKKFAANSSYLITIQFGIIKIELITINANS